MAKLSHIDDIEQRNQAEQAQAAAVAREQAPSAAQGSEAMQPEAHIPPIDEDMTAEEEEEFHGLDSNQPMSTGHKALIVLAVVVVLVAMLYIVNSWIHFI